jgi:small subunit ribosomal protein S7
MPRRREVPRRIVLPDPKYNSVLVAKFIRSVMRDGKKSTAERLLYDAFEIIEQKTSEAFCPYGRKRRWRRKSLSGRSRM